MRHSKNIVISSLFTAFITLLTLFPQIPIAAGSGYIHMGDAFIITAAYFIGVYGVPAAAIGSILADIISGYSIYVPATFIIKGLMAFTTYLLLRKNNNIAGVIFAAVICEIIMSAGYFLYDTVIYGFAAAAVTLPFSLIQAGAGIIIGSALCLVIKKLNLKEKFNNF